MNFLVVSFVFAASLSWLRTVGDNVVWTDERTQSDYIAEIWTRIIPHYHPEIQGETSLLQTVTVGIWHLFLGLFSKSGGIRPAESVTKSSSKATWGHASYIGCLLAEILLESSKIFDITRSKEQISHLVISDACENPLEYTRLFAYIFQVNMLFLVPPLVIFLAKTPMVKKFDLSSVIATVSAAAPLSKETEQEGCEVLGVSDIFQGRLEWVQWRTREF